MTRPAIELNGTPLPPRRLRSIALPAVNAALAQCRPLKLSPRAVRVSYTLLIGLFLASPSFGGESYTVFREASLLPKTIVEWREYFEERYDLGDIVYQSEIVARSHSFGFKVSISTPGMILEHWIGIGHDSKKELPLSLTVTDKRMLFRLVGSEAELKKILALPDVECTGNQCVSQVIGGCSDIGCDIASFKTSGGQLTTVSLRYVVD